MVGDEGGFGAAVTGFLWVLVPRPARLPTRPQLPQVSFRSRVLILFDWMKTRNKGHKQQLWAPHPSHTQLRFVCLVLFNTHS